MLDGLDATDEAVDGSALGGEPVALSSLISHGVRLQWYEAVAVAQEICERQAGVDTQEPVPDLDHIRICSDGRIAIAAGTIASQSSPTHPVVALGQLLLSVVDEVGLPIQLELVVQSAISLTPAYATAAEFSKALVRFDRPDRALAFRELYGRWNELPAEARSAPAPAIPPPPLPPVTPQVASVPLDADAMELFLPEEAPRGHRRFPILPIAAAASVILAAAGVAAWGLPSEPARPSAPPVPAVFSEAQKAAVLIPQQWKGVSDLDAASDSAGLDTIPGQGLPVGSAPTGRARGPVWSSANPAARPGPRAGEVRGSGAPLPPAVSPTENSARATAPSSPMPSPAPGRDAAVDERLVVPPTEPTGPVYSSSDGDVVPPELIQPRLSLEPPAGARREDLTVFDVLVSDDGRVETIRLAGPARDYREAMVFSAAKMWRFRPAMRDGRAVRYMKRVWIAVSPIGMTIR